MAARSNGIAATVYLSNQITLTPSVALANSIVYTATRGYLMIRPGTHWSIIIAGHLRQPPLLIFTPPYPLYHQQMDQPGLVSIRPLLQISTKLLMDQQ